MDENKGDSSLNQIVAKLDSINSKIDSLSNRVSSLEIDKNTGAQQPAPVVSAEPVSSVSNKDVADYFKTASSEPLEIPPTQSSKNFEVEVGQMWLPRIGIAALVVGVALFLIYSLAYFGPVGKITIGYLTGLALLALGYFLEKKYQLFGRIMFGGGVAVTYFVTYAMYYFKEVQLINNEYLAISLLLAIAIGYFYYIYRYNEESFNFVPLGLIFLTVNLGGIALFSLTAITIFLVFFAALVLKKSWKNSYGVSMILAYVTFFRWVLPGLNFSKATQGEIFLSLSMLAIFFIIFTILHLKIFNSDVEPTSNVGLILINGLAFFALFFYIVTGTFEAATALLFAMFAILNGGLALLSKYLLGNRIAARGYLALAVFFTGILIPELTDGFVTLIGWWLMGIAFTFWGILKGTIRTRAIGLAFWIFVALSAFSLKAIDGEIVDFQILAMAMFIFSEVVSVVLIKTVLNKNESDKAENETYLQASHSILSVAMLVIFLESLVSAQVLTLSWGIAAALITLVGFAVSDKYFRRAGLVLLLIVALKLFLFDIAGMDIIFRILSFIILGVVLLGMSFGYHKYKSQIERYL